MPADSAEVSHGSDKAARSGRRVEFTMTFKTEVIGDSFQVVVATMVNMAMKTMMKMKKVMMTKLMKKRS